jgi:DNA-binding CsgD family transcriptional regulator
MQEMVTKAERIRKLSLEGRAIAEIARSLNISDQYPRHVLDRSK